jgi:hypothetical protein
MRDTTARALGTIGIWISVAVILAFGVFRINWNGDSALFAMFLTVVVICGGATISTAAVWGWGRSRHVSGKSPQEEHVRREDEQVSDDLPRDDRFRSL